MDAATLKAKFRGMIKSTTIWFNALLLATIPYVDSIIDAASSNMPIVSQWLSPNMVQNVAVFILVGNILLRAKTNKGLEDK